MTLPEGMTVDPSAADGLQACIERPVRPGLDGGTGRTRQRAHSASQIGTVEGRHAAAGKAARRPGFIGEPECSPCGAADAEAGRIFRLFLQVRSPERGVIVKLAGHVSANPTTGRLQATFTEQPQLPFSELLLTFNGGATGAAGQPADVRRRSRPATDLTPWSTSGLGGLSGTEAIAGTPDATPSSSFNVDWNGAGGACPAACRSARPSARAARRRRRAPRAPSR